MKGIANRQKPIVKPREDFQKFKIKKNNLTKDTKNKFKKKFFK